MRILNFFERTIVCVRTDEVEFNEYTRYGPDLWFKRMGQEDYPVHACSELERLYQEVLNENVKKQD